MIIPQFLNIGDTIGIVALAGITNKMHLNNAIDVFTKWGFKTIVGKYVFENHNNFSATDEHRADDVNNMIHNQDVKAIISLRGGYGTARILDKIDINYLITNPKWIIGFSDITALHSALNRVGVCSLHASMPTNFNTTDVISLESLKNALLGFKNRYEINTDKLNILGKTKAEIIGGNLSVLYSLNSTKYDLDFNDKILFIEDLNEYLYHIDRMMLNFKLSGKLSKLKAIIVGGMSDMLDNEIPFGKSAYEIILEHVKEYNYPVLFNFPAGHIQKNYAITMGSIVSLNITKELSFVNFV